MTVTAGDPIHGRDLVVRTEPMKTMAALLGDPNPIHWDTRAVAALGLGDSPVNQGPLNMGYIQTMLGQWAGGRDRIRDFRVRFLGNVFGGQTVRPGGEVRALSDDGHGLVAECAVWLDVVDGARVLEGRAVVALHEDRKGSDPG
ncbi:MaoC family dehydratase [Gordonia zhaorongruii]|uniref:MaoC family dehydratase n=1 Tax=Gordonia zhaorongruii TaxID=2597659 RepID=UPI001046CD6B|nr:MaoC family dehydratase [Gordonia zhaorongruii]